MGCLKTEKGLEKINKKGVEINETKFTLFVTKSLGGLKTKQF